MPKAHDMIRVVQRGEAPPPPIALLIGFTLPDVEPGRAVITFDAERLVARASSTCMTLRGGQAVAR